MGPATSALHSAMFNYIPELNFKTKNLRAYCSAILSQSQKNKSFSFVFGEFVSADGDATMSMVFTLGVTSWRVTLDTSTGTSDIVRLDPWGKQNNKAYHVCLKKRMSASYSQLEATTYCFPILTPACVFRLSKSHSTDGVKNNPPVQDVKGHPGNIPMRGYHLTNNKATVVGRDGKAQPRPASKNKDRPKKKSSGGPNAVKARKKKDFSP